MAAAEKIAAIVAAARAEETAAVTTLTALTAVPMGVAQPVKSAQKAAIRYGAEGGGGEGGGGEGVHHHHRRVSQGVVDQGFDVAVKHGGD